MYLLMLLATFISAIYGFNLSARADYDRDVARKKAMGIVYRFLFQDDTAAALLGRINRKIYEGTEYDISWTLPGDIVYADYENSRLTAKNRNTTLFYKQNANNTTPKIFYMRSEEEESGGGGGGDYEKNYADNYLLSGRRFYDGKMMVTKVICPDKELQKENVKQCTPDVDETVDDGEGNHPILGTCCNKGRNYIATYRKMDSRWLNRIHLGVSLDFMRAIVNRNYTDNIGIIHWDGSNWQFQGKINFPPVYADEMEAWEEEHAGEEGDAKFYPEELRNRSVWTLPNTVFDRNFFQDKDGNNICDSGCLFHIRHF